MLSTALGDSSRRAVAAGPHSHTRGYNLLWILWYPQHGGREAVSPTLVGLVTLCSG